jgi:hypothetical protein
MWHHIKVFSKIEQIIIKKKLKYILFKIYLKDLYEL